MSYLQQMELLGFFLPSLKFVQSQHTQEKTGGYKNTLSNATLRGLICIVLKKNSYVLDSLLQVPFKKYFESGTLIVFTSANTLMSSNGSLETK